VRGGAWSLDGESGVVVWWWLWLWHARCHATGLSVRHSAASGSWLQVAAMHISAHAAAHAAHHREQILARVFDK
jgi:hypothetical protein